MKWLFNSLTKPTVFISSTWICWALSSLSLFLETLALYFSKQDRHDFFFGTTTCHFLNKWFYFSPAFLCLGISACLQSVSANAEKGNKQKTSALYLWIFSSEHFMRWEKSWIILPKPAAAGENEWLICLLLKILFKKSDVPDDKLSEFCSTSPGY